MPVSYLTPSNKLHPSRLTVTLSKHSSHSRVYLKHARMPRQTPAKGRCYFPSLWMENSLAQFATFVLPCGRTKVASVGYFPSTDPQNFFVSFTFCPQKTQPTAPFSIYAHKNPLLTHKLSILQLNQAIFDLPGSAIIHTTHKPSRQNSFYKFRKKLLCV